MFVEKQYFVAGIWRTGQGDNVWFSTAATSLLLPRTQPKPVFQSTVDRHGQDDKVWLEQLQPKTPLYSKISQSLALFL